MGCVGSKQKEELEGENAPGDAPNKKPLIEEDKASVGVNEDLPFIDENGDKKEGGEKKDEEKGDEEKKEEELPNRESIVLKEETKDSENVQVIKEEGDGVEHERVIVTKQVKVIREEMQFTRPGDPEPSTEEKKSTETETIKERHVITKRVLQIDGEDVPGTETTKEEVTREVIVNEEKEETADPDADKKDDTVEKETSETVEAAPEPENQEVVNHDQIQVQVIEADDASSPEPLTEDQVNKHLSAEVGDGDVIVNGHEDDVTENGTVENGEVENKEVPDDEVDEIALQKANLIENQPAEATVEG